MKTIYIDSEFKCYVTSGEGRRPVETDAFDGKCDAYIEGYRFVPSGQTWTRADDVVFNGEMVAPWKPWRELNAAQPQYAAMTAELGGAYQEGVNSL